MTDVARKKAVVSVCTPTYNRAKYLPRVFESLSRQTRRNFEWIVVDDGSVDNTETVVAELLTQATFPVRYHKQENSGKHVAVNRALDLAEGDLFVIVDSDDACTDDMLAIFEDEWSRVQSKDTVAGLTFLTAFSNGSVVGSKFPHDYHTASLPLYYDKYKVAGDKCDVHRTTVLRAHKFPETGEKFCPESLVWNRISRSYDTVFINKVVKVVEYLPDGLSANILKLRINSPVNTITFYDELFSADISFGAKLRAGVNLFRFIFHTKGVVAAVAAKPLYAPLMFIPASLLYMRDRWLLTYGGPKSSKNS